MNIKEQVRAKAKLIVIKCLGGSTCRGVQLGWRLPRGDENHPRSGKRLFQQPLLWCAPEKQPDVP